MSCYFPFIGVPTGKLTENGKPEYKLRKCDKSRDPLLEFQLNDGSVLIPCGSCLGCRLDRSRRWADRMMLELQTAGCGVFVTLTYAAAPVVFDDAGEPIFWTLDKKHCQDFMKRLREHFKSKKIRFFLAGEYGGKTLRPHYHVILFGLSLDDFPDLVLRGKNELGQKYYTSFELEKIWKHGFVMLSEVSYETCAYVARYVQKKMLDSGFELKELGCQPEFTLMSRRPGIGKDFLDQHPDCLDFAFINVSGKDKGRKIPIPKYFLQQYSLTNPDEFAIISAERRKFASDKLLLQLQQTSLSFNDYFSSQEQSLRSRVKVLERNKV